MSQGMKEKEWNRSRARVNECNGDFTPTVLFAFKILNVDHPRTPKTLAQVSIGEIRRLHSSSGSMSESRCYASYGDGWRLGLHFSSVNAVIVEPAFPKEEALY
jgi:hypothetical protein